MNDELYWKICLVFPLRWLLRVRTSEYTVLCSASTRGGTGAFSQGIQGPLPNSIFWAVSIVGKTTRLHRVVRSSILRRSTILYCSRSLVVKHILGMYGSVCSIQTESTMKIKIKAQKPRNPSVGQMHFRKAGKHKMSRRKERRNELE